MIASVTTPVARRSSLSLAIFGEFFIDLVFYDLPSLPRLGEEVKTNCFAELPGGGLATTALLAARLGTSTAVITRVGRDARLSPAWRRLVNSRVDVQASEFIPSFPTARTVCAAFGDDRMMITYDGIHQNFEKLLQRPATLRKLRNAKHIHFACALWPVRSWLPWIRRLRAEGHTLSADIGWHPKLFQSPDLSRLLQEFNFVFPNKIEALAITRQRTLEKALWKLAQWIRIPIIKLGADGSVAIQNGKAVRAKSIRVRSLDATGAGDAFNGGFLHGYLSGWRLADCLQAGNVCGALATTAAGGSSAMPTRMTLKQLMRKIDR